MPAITAQMVKELREQTGFGMKDVKEALTATDGDMEQAAILLAKREADRRRRSEENQK